jgi:hypothetical protein
MRAKACGCRRRKTTRNAPVCRQSLISIKDPARRFRILPPNQQEVAMPVDSILVSAAVVSVFVVFAAVLIWADFQTERQRQEPANPTRKRRSF